MAFNAVVSDGRSELQASAAPRGGYGIGPAKTKNEDKEKAPSRPVETARRRKHLVPEEGRVFLRYHYAHS